MSFRGRARQHRKKDGGGGGGGGEEELADELSCMKLGAGLLEVCVWGGGGGGGGGAPLANELMRYPTPI